MTHIVFLSFFFTVPEAAPKGSLKVLSLLALTTRLFDLVNSLSDLGLTVSHGICTGYLLVLVYILKIGMKFSKKKTSGKRQISGREFHRWYFVMEF